MARSIVIIGSFLGGNPAPESFLARLRARSGDDVTWTGIRVEPPRYSIASECAKDYRRLLHCLRTASSVRGTASAETQDPPPSVMKLYYLPGSVQSELYRACSDPISVPKDIANGDALIEWLFSPAANLFPKREWLGNSCEAAFVAVLVKLIGNKSWNKDQHGHQWTKEQDLLGQAPVSDPQFPDIRAEALPLLQSLGGLLLLPKGYSQGKTPREWSINTKYLAHVKAAILNQSFDRLAECPELAHIMTRIAQDTTRNYCVHEIVTERVRQICRQRE